MMKKGQSSILLHEYFKQWIFLYKKGAVRDVTMQKILDDAETFAAFST